MPLDLKKNWLFLIGFILSLGFLLIAGSIAYYYLFVLPAQQTEKMSFEREKYEQVLKEKEDKKKEEEVAKEKEEMEALAVELALESCLSEADVQYSADWSDYCAIWKLEVKDTYEDCKKRWTNIGWTLQEAKDWCWTNTPDYNEDENESCYLPSKYGDKVDELLEGRKSDCYKKYS